MLLQWRSSPAADKVQKLSIRCLRKQTYVDGFPLECLGQFLIEKAEFGLDPYLDVFACFHDLRIVSDGIRLFQEMVSPYRSADHGQGDP